MNTPSYAEQWQKLTSAYVNNKVEPFIPCACFVGNLLNNTSEWIDGRGDLGKRSEYDTCVKDAINSINKESNGLYTLDEIITLEKNFMVIATMDPHGFGCYNEDSLFKAFESTLELLKEIHISKGEVIEGTPVFTKRVLVS